MLLLHSLLGLPDWLLFLVGTFFVNREVMASSICVIQGVQKFHSKEQTFFSVYLSSLSEILLVNHLFFVINNVSGIATESFLFCFVLNANTNLQKRTLYFFMCCDFI